MIPSFFTHWKIFLVSFAALGVTIMPTPPSSPQSFDPSTSNVGVLSGYSRNWSGYTATNGTFISVTGTWTIPTTTNSGHTSTDATWVGIGGIKSNDLIQSGTQNIISSNGQVTTTAFYELLPIVPQSISSVSVKTGDSITVTITQQSAGQWLINFNNNSTNQNYQTTITYNSSLSSAEWIEEAPSNGRSILPLDTFGTVSFTSGSATQNGGNQQSLSGNQAQAITMTNRQGQALATVSPLGSDGASFTITRTSAISNSPLPELDRNPQGFRRHGFSVGQYTQFPRGRQYWITPTVTPTYMPSQAISPVQSWNGNPSMNFRGRRFHMLRRGLFESQ